MKASEVVLQLATRLPQVTDAFTTNIEVNSLTRSGTIITAHCDDSHNLESGDAVSIVGAFTPIVVGVGGVTRVLTQGTVVTDTDHDLTEPIASTITLSGNTVEAEFNGTFEVLSIPNRRTIVIKVANSGATVSTSAGVLENAESARRSYNGLYKVLETPNAVEFTFEHLVTSLPNPGGVISARAKTRVAAAVNPERAVAAYTKQEIGDAWMFVILEDVTSAKDRASLTDGIGNRASGSDHKRQQLTQPVTVYVFLPVREDITGAAQGRDAAEDLFLPICQSILGKAFDSGLTVGPQGELHFFGHRSFEYNPAVYVHAFSFEQTVDLLFEDTVGAEEDVAFRQIELTLFPDLEGQPGVANITSSIDLDDTPL